MNGIPKLDALRSISLYGLSSVTMNFQYDTDPYFARAQAFERIPTRRCPTGVTPGMSPLFSPSGLIYRYVLQSPDRSAQRAQDPRGLGARAALSRDPGRRRRLQPRRRDDAVPGAARSAPADVVRRDRAADRRSSSPATTPTPAAASIPQGGQFYYVRGLGLVKSLEDIGNIVVAAHGGIPVTVNDVGTVAIGSRAAARAVRLHGPERRRRRGHPDARRRAGAGDPEEGPGADRDAQPERAAAGREDRPVLRPDRADRRRRRRPSSATWCAACCSCSSCSASFSSASGRR